MFGTLAFESLFCLSVLSCVAASLPECSHSGSVPPLPTLPPFFLSVSVSLALALSVLDGLFLSPYVFLSLDGAPVSSCGKYWNSTWGSWPVSVILALWVRGWPEVAGALGCIQMASSLHLSEFFTAPLCPAPTTAFLFPPCLPPRPF